MQTKKYGWYFLFCLLEMLYLLLFTGKVIKEDAVSYLFRDYFQEDSAEGSYEGFYEGQGGNIYTEEMILPKGIYEVTLMYEKGKGRAVCYAVSGASDTAGPRAVYSDHVSLSDVQDKRKFSIYVNENDTAIKMIVEPENPDTFIVNWITIATAGNSGIYRIFCMTVKLLAFNIAAAVIYFRKRKFQWSIEVTGVLIIGGIASLGLMEEYILYGHDLIFHLFRIEGLAEGLRAGNYPVRIQPGWFNGWGYPVSVMYGEQLLLFPAVLRLLGVSVQNAYKCYIGVVNLGTAAVAYYSFFRISGDKKIALCGSCIYTLLPYRLSCIYIRAAVGEYSAMLFLPLVVLGFFYAFAERNDFAYGAISRGKDLEKNISQGKVKESIPPQCLIAPVIGFTGLIQTHVIACFLTAFAIVLFGIFNWKKILQKDRVIYFARIFGITVLINLWFLYPFFCYMQEDFVVNLRHGMEPVFQNFGASLAELFAVYWNGTLNTTWSNIGPLSEKFPKPVGSVLLVILAMAVLMYYNEKLSRQKRKIVFCGGFLVLFSAMASNIFPYSEINRLFPALGGLFGKIQFPFRMLMPAGLFGSLLTVLVLMEVSVNYGRKTTGAVMVLLGLLAVMQGTQLIYSTLYRGDMCLAYDIAAFESNAVSTGEYLYEGSWGPATESIQVPAGASDSGVVKIEGFEKKYNDVTVICRTGEKEALLLIPLYYYPGYTAADVNTGERFAVQKYGGNNQISVLLPAGYEGVIGVCFKEPVSWRVSEVISAVSIVVFLLMAVRSFRSKSGGRSGKTVASPV